MSNPIGQLIQMTSSHVSTMDKKEMSELLNGVLRIIADKIGNLDHLVGVSDKLDSLSSDINAVNSKMNLVNSEFVGMRSEVHDLKLEFKDTTSKFHDMKSNVKLLTDEMHYMKSKLQQLESMENSMNDIPIKMLQLEEKLIEKTIEMDRSLHYHQEFLEEMDMELRNKRLVITGVSETDISLGLSDKARAVSVLKKTGVVGAVDLENIHVKRLGELRYNTQARPILVVVENNEIKKQIVQNSKNLKEINGFANIYIRNDVHPSIRFELNRLRKKEQKERMKVENRNSDIVFDWRERVLRKNGMVIDRFSPSFERRNPFQAYTNCA